MFRFRQKRFRETRLFGAKPGLVIRPPTILKERGFKVIFYNTSGQKIGELGSDVQEGRISAVEFDLQEFGCGAFRLVLDEIPAFPIGYRTRVTIHPFFDETPWFAGFIQQLPGSGAKRPVEYRGFGFYEQLDWVTVTGSYENQDVSDIVKDIIGNIVSPKTQIVYNSLKVETSGYTVSSIEFDHTPAKDAIQMLADVAQTFEFGVDNEREFYFRAISTVEEHHFWAGKHFKDDQVEIDPLGVRNKLFIKAGQIQAGGTNIIGYVEDLDSIAEHGLREEVVTAPEILDGDDAVQWANYYLDQKKDPSTKAKISGLFLDQYKVKIEARGKIRFTTEEGIEHSLAAKRVTYRIDAAGILADIELGELIVPYESHLVKTMRRLQEEERLADQRTKQLYGGGGGGASAFLDLTDTPSSYPAGSALKFVRVGALENGLDFFNYAQVATVAKSGAEFDSIQDAIDSITDASATKRYMVRVMPGRYQEQVTCKSWVDIRGFGKHCTQIDYPSDNGSVILADYVQIEDILIEGQTAASNWAIVGTNTSHWHLRNVDILSPFDSGKRSQGIKVTGNTWATGFIEHCVINCYTQTGNALYLTGNGQNIDVTLNDVFIDTWDATSGGGIYLYAVKDIQIRNSYLRTSASGYDISISTSATLDLFASWLEGGAESLEIGSGATVTNHGSVIETSSLTGTGVLKGMYFSMAGHLALKEQAGDALTPPSTWGTLYVKSDGKIYFRNDAGTIFDLTSGGGVSDHGALSGLEDDDHPQYSRADGTRAFTGVVSGIDPTADAHLATKKYVDDHGGVTDHGDLSGLGDDDHPQYVKADGTRAFTGVVGGIDPTLDAHLATKKYVDDAVELGPGGSGIRHDHLYEKFDALTTGAINGQGDYHEANAWAVSLQSGASAEVAVKSGDDKMLRLYSPANKDASRAYIALTSRIGITGGARLSFKMRSDHAAQYYSGGLAVGDGSTTRFQLYFDYSSGYKIMFYNGTTATAIQAASADTWYQIDLVFGPAYAQTAHVSIFVDGVYKTKLQINTTMSKYSEAGFYVYTVGSSGDMNFDVDDFAVLNLFPIGIG